MASSVQSAAARVAAGGWRLARLKQHSCAGQPVQEDAWPRTFGLPLGDLLRLDLRAMVSEVLCRCVLCVFGARRCATSMLPKGAPSSEVPAMLSSVASFR